MPKKTKKQKLRALLHRHTSVSTISDSNSRPIQSSPIHTPSAYIYTPTPSKTNSRIQDEHAIKKDIVKTIILIIIILGIEFLLSRYLS